MLRIIDSDEPRQQHIDVGADALVGDFDLFDVLAIRSTTGTIDIGVHPQLADKENPAPAELLIDSSAGHVSVNFSAVNAPERDYRVSIDTRAGAVDGNILHGRTTSISTVSGRIQMRITPYASDDYASTLRTSSVAGEQQISLLSPEKWPHVPIKHMSSHHTNVAGALILRYPKEWEGTIEGYTRFGNMEVCGEDLHFIRRGVDSRKGQYVLAKKGEGNSTLNFHNDVGHVDLRFD